MLPFYQAKMHPTKLKPGTAEKGNLGLFFSRFFDWDDSFNITDKRHIDAKKQFLEQFKRPDFGDQQHISRLVLKQMLLNQSLPSTTLVMRSDWHWVTGMGNSHPLENGFSWHHTLSMPYLPGSSVKGLLRAYCEITGMAKAELKQWFGSESKNPEQSEQDNQAGELIFFDAIPCSKASILPDVMTPHSGDWQEKGGSGSTAPADWHDPNPVGFLVAKNLTLLFSVALASHASLNHDVLKVVKSKLEEALGFLGAGAKTATGYGTMSVDESGDKKLNEMLQTRLEELAQSRASREQANARMQMTEQQRIIEDLLVALTEPTTKSAAMSQIEALANGGVADWSASDRALLASKLRAHEYAKISNKDKAKARKELIAKIEQA